MKKIEAIVRPEMLAVVKLALEEIGMTGMTITRVEGRGRQRGITQTYQGKKFNVDFLTKVKLELFVDDKDVENAVKAIRDAAMTGQVGDGKIIILPIEDVVRIRTNERGTRAI